MSTGGRSWLRVACCIGMLVLAASCEDGGDGGSNGLLVADFESGRDPTNLGGRLQQWNKGARVSVGYGSYGGRATGYAQISGNNGSGGWTGAGLVLVLSDKAQGLDLSSYSDLRFDVAVAPGSQLGDTAVKFEDTGGNARAERPIRAYAAPPADGWQSVKIPLSAFQLKAGDPSWWSGLDSAHVVHFVTVSVRDADTPNGDGTLYIDNVRFE